MITESLRKVELLLSNVVSVKNQRSVKKFFG